MGFSNFIEPKLSLSIRPLELYLKNQDHLLIGEPFQTQTTPMSNLTAQIEESIFSRKSQAKRKRIKSCSQGKKQERDFRQQLLNLEPGGALQSKYLIRTRRS